MAGTNRFGDDDGRVCAMMTGGLSDDDVMMSDHDGARIDDGWARSDHDWFGSAFQVSTHKYARV